jgi:hypothetical protein
MRTTETLYRERKRLEEDILRNLDFLMGSISTKGPSRPGLNLTFKINQVTRTRHIRKELEPRVKQMTTRWRRLRDLLHQLSDLNWERLNREQI